MILPGIGGGVIDSLVEDGRLDIGGLSQGLLVELQRVHDVTSNWTRTHRERADVTIKATLSAKGYAQLAHIAAMFDLTVPS